MSLLVSVDRAERSRADIELMLRAQVQERDAAKNSTLSRPHGVLEWAMRYRRIDNHPFNLSRFQPIEAIYADNWPRIAIIKPAQRGLSEWAINYALFALECGAPEWAPHKDGLNVGYIFPTQASLGDFSKERLTGIKDESPYLQRLLGSSEFAGIMFKKIGRSYLYMRGGWSESQLLSFACDALILDEYDRMDNQAVALARRRLNASEVGREVALSTPTLPGVGIHSLYLQSDRRHYETRCSKCGTWTEFDFFNDVRVDDEPFKVWQRWQQDRIRRSVVTLNCPGCNHALTDTERCEDGRWVIGMPEAEAIHGYWVPWWPFPMVNLQNYAATAVDPDPGEQQEFFRSDLGLTYRVGGAAITTEMLLMLSADLPDGRLPEPMIWRQTVMGVDVGAVFHYSIDSIGTDDERPTVRAMGSVAHWSDLDDLMERYHVRLCVVDELPEQHGSEAFSSRHVGKVLRARYPAGMTQGALFTRPHQPAQRVIHGAVASRRARQTAANEGRQPTDIVSINRTMALDAVQANISGARERWPSSITRDDEVQRHMSASVRVETPDSRGQMIPSWVHTGPDHLNHARVYALVARAALPKPTLGGLSQAKSTGGWGGRSR